MTYIVLVRRLALLNQSINYVDVFYVLSAKLGL